MAQAKRPNILWIITDQQSHHMMSCSGNRFVQTPNMDYLAQEGVRFTNAYCTNPVCLPSRFSLMTGRYPGEIGLKSNSFQQEVDNIPSHIMRDSLGSALRKSGYNTVYAGKEHLPYMDASSLGFEYLSEDERDIMADVCADYILKYKDDKPFTMVASLINPHDICFMAISDFYDSHSQRVLEYVERTGNKELETLREAMNYPKGMHPDVFFDTVCPPLPDNYKPAEDEPEAIAMLQAQRPFKKFARAEYTDKRWRLHRWAYAQLTAKADSQVGKILRALKNAGQWDNTVILFTSDHGDMDASHKMEHKEALYEECCRIPLIIKGLRGQAGVTAPYLVSNGLDCICTVLDYAGAKPFDGLKGLSLKTIVETGKSLVQRDSLIIESECGTAAVTESLKYTEYFRGNNRRQFYDLTVNPGENYNQIDDPKYQEQVERLQLLIEAHKQSTPLVAR